MSQSPLRAIKAAHDILDNVRRGKAPAIVKTAMANGYPRVSAENGGLTRTKAYRNTIAPVLRRWEKERDRITSELENKDLTKEKYATLMSAMDTLTKNIQLLSGGRIAVEAPLPILQINEFHFTATKNIITTQPKSEEYGSTAPFPTQEAKSVV